MSSGAAYGLYKMRATASMPDHLRPLTVEIPVTWTAEQALAVWEMLDQLREKVWVRYRCQLQDLLAEQQRYSDLDNGDEYRLLTALISNT
jgi:hypothetical protein